MPVTTKLTFSEVPKVDTSVDYFDSSDKEIIVDKPNGVGWKHENSFLGNNSVIHVWKKGVPDFDEGYELYWTGYGDDVTNGIIGEGQEIFINISDTDTTDQSVEFEFIAQDTFLYGGHAVWSGTQIKDSFSLLVIAKENVFVTTGDQDLTIGNDGRAIYVGTGNGTHSFSDTPVITENKTGTGYWNCDFETGLQPATNGDGFYDILNYEKTVARIINKVHTIGADGTFDITAENSWNILHGYKFRLVAHVDSNNPHAWQCGLSLSMFRRSTI